MKGTVCKWRERRTDAPSMWSHKIWGGIRLTLVPHAVLVAEDSGALRVISIKDPRDFAFQDEQSEREIDVPDALARDVTTAVAANEALQKRLDEFKGLLVQT